MQATQEQIEILTKLQQVDRAAFQAKKAFDELPQRQKILDIRAKRDELAKKARQAREFLETNRKKIADTIKTDESHAKRAEALQSDIEKSSDFRNIEKKTKELDGLMRLREACSETLTGLESEERKITQLIGQIDEAIKKADAKEEALIASFRKDGGALQQKLAALQRQRSELAARIEGELGDTYEKALKAGAGIAVGRLEGEKCGVCRWHLQDNQLISIRKQAPLGTCPNCKRLLVVE